MEALTDRVIEDYFVFRWMILLLFGLLLVFMANLVLEQQNSICVVTLLLGVPVVWFVKQTWTTRE